MQGQRFKSAPWDVISHTDVKEDDDPTSPIVPHATSTQIKNYGNVNLNPKNYFDHIYGREPHILRVRSAIEVAVETNLQSRHHCVLYGPPGCGKTEILLAIGKMLGEENKAYMKFDATSMTQAGVLRILMGASVVPPVLIVEEIEKTSDRDLRWLLGLLDKRGEIRQTNFNVGNRMKNVKMLCLATVNNFELFSKVMSGAVASRFAHRIYCSRPDRNLMQKILEREIKLVKGNLAWVEPTLKFCVDEQSWNDPRQIIPICICGKERLLTGEYQAAVKATMPKKEEQSNIEF